MFIKIGNNAILYIIGIILTTVLMYIGVILILKKK